MKFVEHHTKNESKKYYKRIQKLAQEFKPRVNACRDAGGKILTEKEHIQKRWKEYVVKVLAGNPNDTDSTIVRYSIPQKMRTHSRAMRK
jgi:hypothetical protein